MEHGCDEKDEETPKEMTLAQKFTLMELLEICHHIESAKVKTLVTYLNIESNVTIH